jgi:hypothetical protein
MIRTTLSGATIVSLLFIGLAGSSAFGGAGQDADFQALNKMTSKELTATAKATVEKKYAGEAWGAYNFPKYAYVSDAVLVGYKIAVKNRELLAKFRCYCFCEEMGHKNLAYCFLKNGALGQFDDHASGCNVCTAQAMHAFLWNELGIAVPAMQKAMKQIYGE